MRGNGEQHDDNSSREDRVQGVANEIRKVNAAVLGLKRDEGHH